LLWGGCWETLGSLRSFLKLFVDGALPGAGLQILEILAVGVSGVMAVSVAYAIFKEKAWGRPALMVFVLLVDIKAWSELSVAISLNGLLRFSVELLPGLVFAYMYLYMWPNVIDYYRHLRGAREEPPNPVDSSGPGSSASWPLSSSNG